jgi:hypothetical protein
MDGWIGVWMDELCSSSSVAVLVVQEMSAEHTVVLAVMIAGSICS